MLRRGLGRGWGAEQCGADSGEGLPWPPTPHRAAPATSRTAPHRELKASPAPPTITRAAPRLGRWRWAAREGGCEDGVMHCGVRGGGKVAVSSGVRCGAARCGVGAGGGG